MSAPATVFARLPRAAFLHVSGTDAASFLQGQFSNDLRRPEPDAATYGLWLNQKGRVLADSHVLACADGTFDIVSATSPAAVIRERLEAYIVADDVTVEDDSAGWVGWVVAGQGAQRWFASMGVDAPPPGKLVEAEGARAFQGRAAGGPSWLVFAPVEKHANWEERFAGANGPAGSVCEVDPAVLAVSRVLAGVPVVPDELGPGDLPAEGGLDHEAVSFTKGCYLGQEAVARLHNLGQVRRRLFVVRWRQRDDAPVLPGTLMAEGRAIGELRSAFRGPEGDWVGLAMVNLAAVTPAMQVVLAGIPGLVLEVLGQAAGRAW